MAGPKKPVGLHGLRVLSLESRRATEMAKLIENHGGHAIVAPSMREVPLESNTEALAFARALAAGGLDMVIFLTGVGTRALARVAGTIYPVEDFARALAQIGVVARGPKPVAALQELNVPVTLAVPEPNTWRDLLRALDENKASLPLAGRRVAVQEYGASNPELLAGLAQRGAAVMRVPVYQWALPEDLEPLRQAVEAISHAEVDMALFTTSIQVVHLLGVAREMNREQELRRGLAGMVVGSIGPVTTEELRRQAFHVDFEPVHPKMGFLVNEAARQAAAMLNKKRQRS
jgi:uroporphyrinogen-III synthase